MLLRKTTATLTNCSRSRISHRDINLSKSVCKARDSLSLVKYHRGRSKTLQILWLKHPLIHTSERQHIHKELPPRVRTLSCLSQTLMTSSPPAPKLNKRSKGSSNQFLNSTKDPLKGSREQYLLRIISRELLPSSLGPTTTPSLESSRSVINSK